MQVALDWLNKNHEEIVQGLAALVGIQSISTDGEHLAEIDRTAKLTCDLMRQAGLHNVEVLKVGQSLPDPIAISKTLDECGDIHIVLADDLLCKNGMILDGNEIARFDTGEKRELFKSLFKQGRGFP